MHKSTKLSQRNRKDIWDKHCEWWKVNDIADYYHVHRNTVGKVLKRARKKDFTIHRSTREDYRWVEYWLKKLLKTETKVLYKKLKNEKIVRYEKKYAWELVHIDVHKSKNIKGQNPKKKKYYAWIIDDATRIVYSEVLPNKKAKTLSEFLKRAYTWFKLKWIIIKKLMSDNWKEFTTHHKQWRSKHKFEKALVWLNIKHIYTRVFRPQTNGKIERFWRILKKEFATAYTFENWEQLISEYNDWLYFYNYKRKHWWIGNITPIEKLNKVLKLEGKIV